MLEEDVREGVVQDEDEGEEEKEDENVLGYRFSEENEFLPTQKRDKIAPVSDRMMDLYHIPASLEKALIYRKTTIPGIPDPSLPHCEFNNEPQRTPYSLFCSKRNKEAPNEVITLYLQNTIFCIIWLFVLFLSQLHVLLTNRKYACKYKYPKSSGECPWSDLEVNFMTPMMINSIITNQEDQKAYQEALVFGLWLKLGIQLSLFILPILFIYLEERVRTAQRTKPCPNNHQNLEISDYSVIVRSTAEYTSDRLGIDGLKAYFEEILEETTNQDCTESEPIKILDYFCTTLRTPHASLLRQANQLTHQINFTTSLMQEVSSDIPKFDEKEQKKLKSKIEKLKKNHKKIQNQLQREERKIRRSFVPDDAPLNERILDANSVVFITFSSTETRNKILRAKRIITSKLKLSFRKPKNPQHNFLKIEPTPKIDKIIWKNCTISEKQRARTQYAVNACCYLCYYIFLKIFQGVVNWMSHLAEDDTNQDPTKMGPTKKDLGLIYPFLVISVQIIFKLSYFLIKKTGTFTDGIVKNGFNFISLIALGCLKSYSYVFTVQKLLLKKDWSFEQLMIELLHILLLDAILQGVMKILSLSLIWKNLKILYFYAKIKFFGKRAIVSQKELNRIFEPVASPIGSFLSHKFSVILTSTFLCVTQTWSLLVAYILYLVISYFVDRYLLLRVYAEPNPEDAKIFVEIRNCILGFTPFSLIISWSEAFLGVYGLGPAINRFKWIYLAMAVGSILVGIGLYFLYLFLGSLFELKLEEGAVVRQDEVKESTGEAGVVEAGSLMETDGSMEKSLGSLGESSMRSDEVEVGGFGELYGQIFRIEE